MTLHEPITRSDAQGIDVADLRGEYARRGMAEWSDASLAHAVADVVRVPRRDPANSFVLHAPLELEARLGLLPFVAEERRELARHHLLAIAAHYEAFGPPIDDLAADPAELPSDVDPLSWLADATAAGDLDDIDRAATELARGTQQGALAADLVDDLAPRSSAAAHGPIFLYHLRRVSPRGELTSELLRPLARELGRNPDWRVRWIDDHAAAPDGDARSLEACLLDIPALGEPGSAFIHPLLQQVDGNASITTSLSDATGPFTIDAARAVLRVAATSMLIEPPDAARYGWTHCLTLPQAVLGLAPVSGDPDRLLAIAATHVAAFRAAQGTGPIARIEVSDLSPGVDREHLATAAATSHDAHVAKYVLACLDAAAFDPSAEALYLAAAQRLLDVWRDLGGDPNDPLAEWEAGSTTGSHSGRPT